MDPADLGNEKASVILADQVGRHLHTLGVYVFAYCSGDGEFTVDSPLHEGDKFSRARRLKELVPSIGKHGSRWAFCQWSSRLQEWGEIHASDGEMDSRLKQWTQKNKPPAYMR